PVKNNIALLRHDEGRSTSARAAFPWARPPFRVEGAPRALAGRDRPHEEPPPTPHPPLRLGRPSSRPTEGGLRPPRGPAAGRRDRAGASAHLSAAPAEPDGA